MPSYELAQLNIGIIKGPIDSPVMARLELLRRKGPTADAFTFRHAYLPPDVPQSSPVGYGDECPAA